MPTVEFGSSLGPKRRVVIARADLRFCGHFLAGERVERRLAAVLAADGAGYSRLMGLDEEATLARLKAVRKTLVDPIIATHRGRIVKTTGDGMLVEFASAVDAARCAIEVQHGMTAPKLVSQMTLMKMGLYSEPTGAYMPSVLY